LRGEQILPARVFAVVDADALRSERPIATWSERNRISRQTPARNSIPIIGVFVRDRINGAPFHRYDAREITK
jgi:hypothetical protein